MRSSGKTKFKFRVHRKYQMDIVGGGKARSLGVAGIKAKAEKLLCDIERDFSDEAMKLSKRKRGKTKQEGRL